MERKTSGNGRTQSAALGSELTVRGANGIKRYADRWREIIPVSNVLVVSDFRVCRLSGTRGSIISLSGDSRESATAYSSCRRRHPSHPGPS